jgi:hypothetical protein
MLRHGWLLLFLFVAALSASGTVHAREALGDATISCSGESHADGDRDQVPADADQGVPHHHGGCHGHVIALEAAGMTATPHPRASSDIFADRIPALTSHLPDPALRPPGG